MCGILGFNFEDREFLKRALNEISHRGPDFSGSYTDRGVSLGHNRLSIIDLSESGKQPMSDKKGEVWIVFNGEIYNHKELRVKLEKKYDFKSNTDTEVLIYLYKEYGTAMLSLLQGMFAFCIYDRKNRIFFLARDRVGIKPLYYYADGKKFIFCSELKGILKTPEIKREIDSQALSSFLTFRANTEEQTLIKGIKKLMPGHFMVYSLASNNIQIKKYWDIPAFGKNNSESYFSSLLRTLLEDSVKSRLMSDVPYGAYLSGGVDSGTVVSLMSRYSPQPIKTFSVGFEQEEHTETNEARFLAEKLNTDHHELLISENSIKSLPKIVYQGDEPMSDPTSIPIYFLSEYAKKYCTVILTGEGADEIFAGYPQYKFMKMNQAILQKTPNIPKKLFLKLLKITPKPILNKGFRFASALGEKGIDRMSNFTNSSDYSEQYLNQVSIFNQEEQSELLDKKMDIYSRYSPYFTGSDLLTSCQKFDFKNSMVDDLLMKVDKNTMAFAVEGRVPFLDYRIVELAFKMPPSLRLRGFTKDKYILRKSVKDLIPKQTQKRKKRHFFVPIDSWLKDPSLLGQELLSKDYLRRQNLFNYSYISKIDRGFKKSPLFYSRQLWSLTTFQIWYRQYIENEKIKL